MIAPLTGRRPGRRAIALLAAYTLALQMLVPVMAAVAASASGSICATDSRGGPVPVDHGANGGSPASCCVGVMVCAAAALPPPAGSAFTLNVTQIESPALWLVLSSVERSRPLRGAHSPRGPPVA